MKRTLLSLLLVLCAALSNAAVSGFGAPGTRKETAIEKTIQTFDLSALEWKLWGYRPEGWRNNFNTSDFTGTFAEHRNIPVKVPGSVNQALLKAGLIKDWNYGLNSDESEWVENRSWLYVTTLPDSWIIKGQRFRIRFKGLDHAGSVILNGKVVGTFNNGFINYTFDITEQVREKDNKLVIAFDPPPKYLGQVYWTSKVKDWKARFYYGWDWIPRIVQIGVWDKVFIESRNPEQAEIENLSVTTKGDQLKESGTLSLKLSLNSAALNGKITVRLKDADGKIILNESLPATQFQSAKVYQNLNVKRWWPNGHGAQQLYQLTCSLTDASGAVLQEINKNIGFKNIQWLPAKDAPIAADPWICSINNKPVFLQGINWTPIRPNFADLTEQDYRIRLKAYKDLGFNLMRVWGGGFPEKDWFYELCDEMGFFIQQDFPLSSSGLDNYPPETKPEIAVISTIVKSYLDRNKHHVAMLMWCAGNELYEYGDGAPVTNKHPMIRAMEEIVKAEDPNIRFVPGSPSGKNIWGDRSNFGKGINWDTHGPWTLPLTETDRTMNAVKEYWKADDALMHSEVGVPGAMSVAMIEKYIGKLPKLPASTDNPYWNRFNWWMEWNDFISDKKSSNATLKDYVSWSQDRQAQGLAIALKMCKDKFPSTGGFIIWMGHDSFPAPINTSIIDFDGNLKPAAYALKEILTSNNK